MAGGAGGYGNEDDSGRMIVDINVTPLVDITLVLLIIFMVTASLIVNPAIKVDLPKAASGTETTKSTLALTLNKEGVLFLNGERSSDEGVVRFIGRELPKNPQLQAIIAADKVVPHGDVIHVIDLVKRSGVHKFAISTDREPAGRESGPAPGEGVPDLWSPRPGSARLVGVATAVAIGLHGLLALGVVVVDPRKFRP